MERSALSLLLHDQPGLLGRIGVALAGVGANIASIVVARTEDPETLRTTVLIETVSQEASEIAAHLESIEGVLQATALQPGEGLERELAIFRVLAESDARARVVEVASVFRARLIDATGNSLTFETVGIPEEIDALQDLLEDFGIIEMARTGPVCMPRSRQDPPPTPLPRRATSSSASSGRL